MIRYFGIVKITAYLKLMRIDQWIKNSFVLLPLFFDGKIFTKDFLIPALFTAVLFSFVCSAIYCLNDIKDIEEDKKHAEKRLRPLPSGSLTKKEAILLFGFLLLAAIAFSGIFRINLFVNLIIAVYFVLNVSYSLLLKKIAIVDIAVIATGYVLRIYAGAIACSIEVTNWIIIMSFLVTLFMAMAKRRDDVLILENTGEKMRHIANRYSLSYVDTSMSILASVTIVAYILYCVSPEVTEHYKTRNLFFTALFVLLGILRYLQITLIDKKSGNPTQIIIKDIPLKIIISLWIASFMYIIYY